MGSDKYNNSQSDILNSLLKDDEVLRPGQLLNPYSSHLKKMNIENNMADEVEASKFIDFIQTQMKIMAESLQDKAELEREILRQGAINAFINNMRDIQSNEVSLKLSQDQIKYLSELKTKLDDEIKEINDRLLVLNKMLENKRHELFLLNEKSNKSFVDYVAAIDYRFDKNILKESFIRDVIITLSNNDKLRLNLDDIEKLGKMIVSDIDKNRNQNVDRFDFIKRNYEIYMKEKLKEKYPDLTVSEIDSLSKNTVSANEGHDLCKAIQNHIEVDSVTNAYSQFIEDDLKRLETDLEISKIEDQITLYKEAKENIQNLFDLTSEILDKKSCPLPVATQIVDSGELILSDIKKSYQSFTKLTSKFDDFEDEPSPINRMRF